jgi:hypothetical protein
VHIFFAGGERWSTTRDTLKKLSQSSIGVAIDFVIDACNTVADAAGYPDSLPAYLPNQFDRRSDVSEGFTRGC